MSDKSANNKRIAKNTLLLYCRMFLTLIIGLYTSRVVLNTLGFSDYGIYNVVGGVVTMLTFLNVGMTGASQRFISYELGKGEIKSLKIVFSNSILTHASIAFIALVIMETIGLWFLNYRMNIPHERMFAANCVFQFSIATFGLSVLSVPFNSCIIAHERMGVYAYISIFEVMMKLVIAYAIMVSSFDKLILYAILIFLVHFIVWLMYFIYCRKHFKECTTPLHFDKVLFKKMFAFAGWGCVGFSLKDQCSNIILNIFFGTTINAARGIASQVNGIINGFASNFTMAMNPQITKQYAAGNLEESRNLAFAGSKYAFFLLSLISIPFLINENYVLRLWLGKIPEYTDIFVYIILLSSLIYSLSHAISTAILATGNIKWFQILLAIILLLEVPAAYTILKLGGKPHQALMPALVTNFLSLILRIVIIHRMHPQYYSISNYIIKIIFRSFLIFIIGYSISYYIHSFFTVNLLSVFITSLISVLITGFVIFVIGLDGNERHFIFKQMKQKLNK